VAQSFLLKQIFNGCKRQSINIMYGRNVICSHKKHPVYCFPSPSAPILYLAPLLPFRHLPPESYIQMHIPRHPRHGHRRQHPKLEGRVQTDRLSPLAATSPGGRRYDNRRVAGRAPCRPPGTRCKRAAGRRWRWQMLPQAAMAGAGGGGSQARLVATCMPQARLARGMPPLLRWPNRSQQKRAPLPVVDDGNRGWGAWELAAV
jgi:hypothetical protein